MEQWLPVVGWEGVYEVSSLANMRRVIGGRSTYSGRPLMPIRLENGYDAVRFRLNGRTSRTLVHAVVVAAFVGPRPRRYEINHLNGIRHDNRLENLEYCTASGNKIHSYAVLNRPKVSCAGERNGRAKVNESQVREIRRRYALGDVSQQSLADEFGLSQSVTSQIIRRTIWSNIS
jgi:hypothetical protein